jgi:hypothetical protein
MGMLSTAYWLVQGMLVISCMVDSCYARRAGLRQRDDLLN